LVRVLFNIHISMEILNKVRAFDLFPIIRSKLIIIRLDLAGELFNCSSHISLKPWTNIAGLRLLYDI